ncbi:MAG: prolyl oligopeptidase family serine peptidase [Cryomorphaceae bacterium]|nr:prolyl oligopeptidase family serine peptidase [Cryomorphaceae bacterium]
MKHLFVIVLAFFTINLIGQTEYTFEYQGLSRDYILYTPSGSTQGMPLVFNLHGYTSNASQQMTLTGMNETASTSGFAVVYAQGTPDSFGINHWNAWQDPNDVDDIGFISALRSYLIDTYAFDANRVYSCGFSNGGIMSYAIACQLSDEFAAIASVAGSMNTDMMDQCTPTRSFPIMEVHGDADLVVAIGGTNQGAGFGQLLSVADVISYWTDFNSCAAPITTPLANPNLLDFSNVVKTEYADCDDGVRVWNYLIEGGGHTWPGAFPTVVFGNTNQDIDVNEEIWDFFNLFSLPQNIATTAHANDRFLDAVYDLTGRVIDVEQVLAGELYVYRFSDGSFEKRVIN